MNISDKLTLLSLIVAVIAFLVAFLQTNRANRLAQRTAESPDLRFTWPFGDSDTLYVLAIPIRRGRVLEIPFSYELSNDGAKTAKDIEVIVRLPSDLCFGGLPAVTFSFQSEKKGLEGRATPLGGGRRQTFAFQVAALHPGTTVRITHPYSFSTRTLITSDISATTADRKEVSLQVQFELFFVAEVVLLCEDRKPWTAEYKMLILDTSQESLSQTLTAYNALLMADHNAMLRRLNWLQRIRYPLKPGAVRAVVVDEASIEEDPNLPIDHVTGELTLMDGRRFPFGYFIPAAGVLPNAKE
jgi:hypothetical protein